MDYANRLEPSEKNWRLDIHTGRRWHRAALGGQQGAWGEGRLGPGWGGPGQEGGGSRKEKEKGGKGRGGWESHPLLQPPKLPLSDNTGPPGEGKSRQRTRLTGPQRGGTSASLGGPVLNPPAEPGHFPQWRGWAGLGLSDSEPVLPLAAPQ